MTKWFALTVLAVFLAFFILDFIMHVGILKGAYEATKEVWRPEAEMNSMVWIFWIGTLVFSFFFVLIFTKGYEGKGMGEGLRYGFYVGLMFSVPMALGTYGSFPITGGIAFAWFVGGLVECLVAGILASAIYRPAVT